MKTLWFGISLVFIAGAAGAAPDGVKLSLKEKRIVKAVEKKVGAELSELNQKCGGAEVAVDIDWKSFKRGGVVHKLVGSACGAIVESAQRVCDDDDGKEAIKTGVRVIRCTFGGKDNAGAVHNYDAGSRIARSAVVIRPDESMYFTASRPDFRGFLAENL